MAVVDDGYERLIDEDEAEGLCTGHRRAMHVRKTKNYF